MFKEALPDLLLALLTMLCAYIARETSRHSSVLFGVTGKGDGLYDRIEAMQRVQLRDGRHIRKLRHEVLAIRETLKNHGMSVAEVPDTFDDEDEEDL